MADIKLTEDQRLAVESRGSSILVSAAAGSGKTKVLVERLMSYITDAENPCDVDSFLIITYTRAAASELRGRIIESINSRVAQEPTNRRLRRQVALSYRAGIGTIHSFCTTVLRENCHLTGLSPDFAIMEEERGDTMKKAVLDRLLEKCYEQIETDVPFRRLVDTVGAGRDDSRLEEIVLELYEKMQSHAWADEWAQEQIDALSLSGVTDVGQTQWGRELMAEAQGTVRYWQKKLDAIIEQLCTLEGDEEKLQKIFLNSLSQTRDEIYAFGRMLDESWDKARALLPISFPRIGSSRTNPNPELSERIKSLRENCKKDMTDIAKRLSDTSERLLADMRAVAPAMQRLLELTVEFEKAYSAEKRRAGLVDFSDLEHIAVSLLYDREADAPTPLAKDISRRYTEIMVDEYQDVNQVQDLIFRCVSREEKNLFMVGDVKQSIYRFRLADPGIFLDKYRRYAPAQDAAEGEPRRILLRENFRSRGCVLDAANHIFSNIMSESLGELDYDEDAMLRLGATYYDKEIETPAEMCIISAPDEDDPEAPDRHSHEAMYVAHRIKQLVDSGAPVTDGNTVRPADYGDFVILLRSPGSAGAVYRRALAERGIPVASEQGGGFFTSVEVSVAMSLLAIIDDPHQDVPLIAVLRSPIFGFTANELTAIRACDKDSDFFAALIKHAENNEKSAAFLEKMNGFRAVAPDLTADELLRHVYTETDLPTVCSAMSDGAARRTNLMLLLDYATRFESSGYRGLYRFSQWLRRLAERGEEPVSAAESGRAVRIMSIHKSKGLEFPYVFISDTARNFNKRDTTKTVLIHSELGLGPKRSDMERRIEYPTIARNAITRRMIRETLSEEMRVLYVAATRAKERLFFTSVWKNMGKKMEKLSVMDEAPVPPQMLIGDGSFSEWLCRCAMLPDSPITLNIVSDFSDGETTAAAPSAEDLPEDGDSLLPELERRLAFRYDHSAAAALPSKLTATEAKGRHETSDDDDAESLTQEWDPVFRVPDFARKDRELTGAERGVATHLVMQHMDFANARTDGGIRAEIERMELCGQLTPQQARAVNVRAISRFFASDIGQRVLNADSIRREFKFSLLCPAEEFYPDAQGEQLLLQGVVDCCIEENGEVTIIDYKTDYVTDETIDERAEFYSGQLRAYARAMERILGKPVRQTVLYFLGVGREVVVN
jgi:ATP-dependent helicase/nuclease subunit A